MRGEQVVVQRPVQTGVNAANNPLFGWESETVDDVLVAPGPREDIDKTSRPAGVIVRWSLYFPRSYTASLDRCRVIVRGQDPCPVVGDPQPYGDATKPTRWNRPVELSRADG
jgi:hypothetical protein